MQECSIEGSYPSVETSLTSAFGRPLLPFTGVNGQLSGALDGADDVDGVSPGLGFLEDSPKQNEDGTS